MEHAIFQFAIIIIFATIASIIARQLKLPLVLAYLLTGIAVSVFDFGGGSLHEFLHIVSSLGVAFLLFLIGIELRISELRAVGIPAVIIGIGQIVITGSLGFGLALLLGFGTTESIVIAIAATFSSTIVAVKLLNTLGATNSLYGRISIGVLLVQDFVAIIALIFLALLNADSGTSIQDTAILLGMTLLKFGVMLGIAYVFVFAGKFIFGYLAKTSQKQESTELFLLGTISWVLAFTFVAEQLGLSLEIGAFLAGVTLSGTGFSFEVVAKIKPLRDFFIILFFILLGTQTSVTSLSGIIVPVVVFSLFVLVAIPLTVQVIMRALGYSQRTNFLTSIMLAQISEFSLIVVAGAFASGLIGEDILSMTTLIAVITITLSSYVIMNGTRIYEVVKKPLAFISRPRTLTRQTGEVLEKVWKDHVVLVGVGRVGIHIKEILESLDVPLLMIDYDPVLVQDLAEQSNSMWLQQKENAEDTAKTNPTKSAAVYGDVGDSDLFDGLYLENARLVISTIEHFEDNIVLVEEVRRHAPKVPIWAIVDSEDEAMILKDEGVTDVIWRHEVLRDYIGDTLKKALKKKRRTTTKKKK